VTTNDSALKYDLSAGRVLGRIDL
jgi:hypothetical protein